MRLLVFVEPLSRGVKKESGGVRRRCGQGSSLLQQFLWQADRFSKYKSGIYVIDYLENSNEIRISLVKNLLRPLF